MSDYENVQVQRGIPRERDILEKVLNKVGTVTDAAHREGLPSPTPDEILSGFMIAVVEAQIAGAISDENTMALVNRAAEATQNMLRERQQETA